MAVSGPGHALVVGGTGMLRGVSLELARRGYVVSVIARREGRLRALAAEAAAGGGRINPLAVDWRDLPALEQALAGAVAAWGPIRLAVVWVHRNSPEAPYLIARAVGAPGEPAAYFHVLGSAGADPSRPEPERAARFRAMPNLCYHEVILGFVMEPPWGSRWLTHAEISGGVLAAIDAGAPRYIVGTVEPWSARP